MKVKEICSCSILAILGVSIIIAGILGKISYFSSSPDAPFYIGILLLTAASFIGFSMKSPDSREEPWP
ncbi:hypothetical protein [Metallosphaera hakonensis]|uniref:Uncharacterized protein n=1 Tax=Metallosphaera hakonensis JCM 8857 = DSM 7519 TaxID=1293036 RepID=A0A2U9ITF7_9CREN|nr:hypothetical protein [Metallosphaera hakonensis]AWR99217.1 hypothetical protein DFR87_05320 [Metallosphaera hakonensis JCM 8857 = DSM 7519]